MQKILLTFFIWLLGIMGLLVSHSVFAYTCNDPAGCNGSDLQSDAATDAKYQTVIVSEKVPGADCICTTKVGPDGKTCDVATPITQRKYECTVEKGLAGFQGMFATIIRWFINIVMLSGVLAIVGVGIAWSLAGGDDAKAKTNLKTWGINILIGMIILFFFRYILQFLAPWIYK